MIRRHACTLFALSLSVVPALRASRSAAAPAATARSAGTASDAQPGLNRVGVAEATEPAIAATLGYGFTEELSPGGGVHHRASLRLAGAASPLPWLNLAPILDARYDVHSDDDGGILDAALAARASSAWQSLRLGGELKAWVPGSESSGTTVDALSLDLRALFGADLGGVTVAGIAGYRLDNSAEAGSSAPRLAEGDRAALGLSEFDAALVGLGANVTFGGTELWGEASGDLLVGEGAPSLSKSPIRVGAGVRQALAPAWAVELATEVSLSERPGVAPNDPLVPIEPRFSALAGIRYRLVHEPPSSSAVSPPPPPRQPAIAPAAKPAPVPPAPPKPTDTVLQIAVVDEQGEPVPDAKLSLTLGGAARELTGDGSGRFRDEHVPPGSAQLAVEAAGFEPLQRAVTLQVGVPLELVLELKALPPPSQVRGVVRTFGGKGLVARVTVAPLGGQTETDATGAFQIDVPPGRYEVSIEAEGYEAQRRTVVVDAQGVVIVNADLVKKR